MCVVKRGGGVTVIIHSQHALTMFMYRHMVNQILNILSDFLLFFWAGGGGGGGGDRNKKLAF